MSSTRNGQPASGRPPKISNISSICLIPRSTRSIRMEIVSHLPWLRKKSCSKRNCWRLNLANAESKKRSGIKSIGLTVSILAGKLIMFLVHDNETSEEIEERRKRFRLKKFYLNDFKILSTLGTGTFGRVRLVKHREEADDIDPLALKCLKKNAIIKLK